MQIRLESRSSTKDGTQSSSEYKRDEGKGFENFRSILGIGLLMVLFLKQPQKRHITNMALNTDGQNAVYFDYRLDLL